MTQRTWRRAAIAMAAIALLSLPYLVAWVSQPTSSVFSGFLINPIDGFSYLAKMRQGANGSWLFSLPYASDPGEGAFLFVFYLALGHLVRVTGMEPILTYHLARLAGSLAMMAAAWAFFVHVLPEARPRRWGFALALAGSGLGWLGLPLGRLAIDLWVPESLPLFSALANPHFPFASAAILVVFTALVAGGMRPALRVGMAAGGGLVLALVQPFAVLTVAVAGAVWLVWLRARQGPASGDATEWRARARALAAFLVLSAPTILYDLWVTRTNPALAAWSAQNLTPTPPLVDVALGFGLSLPLAIAGCFRPGGIDTERGRLLVTWLIVGGLLVFLPLPLQRRMLLGLFFPMAALAGIALASLGQSPRPGVRLLPAVLFALSLPSLPLVVLGAIGAALGQEPTIVLSRPELESYRWVGQNLPRGSLMLAGEVSGNRLPAFGEVRVIYGHPFETPRSDVERAFVREAYTPGGNAADLARLSARGVDYIYLGPREAEIGVPPFLEGLPVVYRSAEVVIYAMPPR